MAYPSGTMAFHFPRKILLTQAGVYFLLSFVLVSVITILRKEKKKKKSGKFRVGQLFHYRGLNHPVKDKVYSRNPVKEALCTYVHIQTL